MYTVKKNVCTLRKIFCETLAIYLTLFLVCSPQKICVEGPQNFVWHDFYVCCTWLHEFQSSCRLNFQHVLNPRALAYSFLNSEAPPPEDFGRTTKTPVTRDDIMMDVVTGDLKNMSRSIILPSASSGVLLRRRNRWTNLVYSCGDVPK